MRQGCVAVTVRMRLRICHGWITGFMIMLMMLVMDMSMLVFHRLVMMQMVVALREVQPDADAHENGRADEADGWVLMEDGE